MPKAFAAVLLFMLALSSAVSQTKPADPRLMSDAEYNVFLSRVETVLPKWETTLKNLDLDKLPQNSNSKGLSLADCRYLGLMQIDSTRTFIARQRVKRTVYGELALKGFLDSLFDMAEEIVWREVIGGVTLTSLEKYAPELSKLNIRLATDAMARVQLLEKGACQ